MATDINQHLAQLEAAIAGAFDAARCRRAVERFVRPAGLDRPVAPILADAFEQWVNAEARPRPSRLAGARNRLANLIAGNRIVDDEAVAAVVRKRMRHTAEREKRWKQRVKQRVEKLSAELGQLKNKSERAPEDDERNVVEVDYPRATIRIHATSRAERKWRARACAKEPWTVAWLDNQVRPGDVVFDLGANVGVFSFMGMSH